MIGVLMYFLGGMTIVGVGWAGPHAVYVDFASDYVTDWHWQLYANRTLIGISDDPSDRRVIGQLRAAAAPAPLTLVRVSSDSRQTDYGAELPSQAWNQYTLAWAASGYPSDADHFEITGSTEPGGSVDADNVLGRVPFGGNRSYQFPLEPFDMGGIWTFRITPRDNALPSGNAGTPSDVAITVAVPPADVVMDDDGNRFSLSVAGGELTVGFEYGE